MKRIIALVTTIVLTLTAFADNRIYIENAETERGIELSLPVFMTNSDTISAFQFDVTVSQGITLKGDGVTMVFDRTTTTAHSLTCRELTDSTYRVICYSNNLATFQGNSGVVAYINIDAPASEGSYGIRLSNIEIIQSGMVKHKCAESSATISVVTPQNDVDYSTFLSIYEQTCVNYDKTRSNTIDNTAYATEKYADHVSLYSSKLSDIKAILDEIKANADNDHNSGNISNTLQEYLMQLETVNKLLVSFEEDFDAGITTVDADEANTLAYEEYSKKAEQTDSIYNEVVAQTINNEEYSSEKYAEIIEEYTQSLNEIQSTIDAIQEKADNAYANGMMVDILDESLQQLADADSILSQLAVEFNDAIAERNTYIARGETGTCSWIIDNDGLLTIAPADGESGDLPEGGWTNSNPAPWYEYGDAGNTVAKGSGTKADPFNVAAAIKLAKSLPTDSISSDVYYIKGKVLENKTSQSNIDSYGNMTFKMIDEGNETNIFTAYRVYNIDNVWFESVDQIQPGQTVTVCGKIEFYNNTTPEIVNHTGYVVSVSNDTIDAERTYITSAKILPGVSAESTSCMFYRLKNMESVDLSGLQTDSLTDVKGMFDSCSGLEGIDLSNLNTQNVVNMKGMFHGCSSLTDLDLSNFNTENVTNMYGMFDGCESLTTLDLSNFDTENVTDLRGMFNGCTSLDSLNLTNFTTANVTSVAGIFGGCDNLKTIFSDNETPSTLKAGTFNTFENRANCTLLVPIGSKALYAAADGWNELGKIIDDDDIAEDLFGELAVSVSEDENIATDALEELTLTFPNALAGTEGYEDYVISLNGDAKVVLVDSEGNTVEEAYAHEVDSVGTVTFSAKLKRGEEYSVIVPRGLYTIDNEEKTYESAADTLSYTTDYVLGDVNDDDDHSVTDIVGISSYIFNGSEEVGLLVVDCNRDGKASVTDISHLVEKIMTDRFPWEEESPARLLAPVAKPQLCLTDNAHGLALSFDNARDFCSMQFDVTLTDDLGNNITSADAVKVKASAGTQGHTVATGMVDGKMRVLVYSVANKAFASDFNVNLNANLNYDCEVSITNAEVTSNSLAPVRLDQIEGQFAGTTGIAELTTTVATQIHDLTGRRLSNPTARGIYVVGKKKVIAK